MNRPPAQPVLITFLVALAVASLLIGYRSQRPADALVAYDGQILNTKSEAKVGEVYYFGFDFAVQGSDSVRVIDVRVIGTPRAMEIVELFASPVRNRTLLGVDDAGSIGQVVWRRPLHDLVVQPQAPPEWQVIVGISINQPEHWTSSALEVEYEAGGRRGTQLYPFRMRVTTRPSRFRNNDRPD